MRAEEQSGPMTVSPTLTGPARAAVLALATIACPAGGAEPPSAEIGGRLYDRHCARCHGPNMVNDGSSFDLRTFPPDDRERFVLAVTRGARLMPAWRDRFDGAELESLWLFVRGGGAR